MMDHYGITSFTLCLLSHGRAIPSCSETEFFHLTRWIELQGVRIPSETTSPFPLMNISNRNVCQLDKARLWIGEVRIFYWQPIRPLFYGITSAHSRLCLFIASVHSSNPIYITLVPLQFLWLFLSSYFISIYFSIYVSLLCTVNIFKMIRSSPVGRFINR